MQFDIQQLRLEPGTWLLIHTPPDLSADQVHALARSVQELQLPTAGILLMPSTYQLATLSAADLASLGLQRLPGPVPTPSVVRLYDFEDTDEPGTS